MKTKNRSEEEKSAGGVVKAAAAKAVAKSTKAPRVEERRERRTVDLTKRTAVVFLWRRGDTARICAHQGVLRSSVDVLRLSAHLARTKNSLKQHGNCLQIP